MKFVIISRLPTLAPQVDDDESSASSFTASVVESACTTFTVAPVAHPQWTSVLSHAPAIHTADAAVVNMHAVTHRHGCRRCVGAEHHGPDREIARTHTKGNPEPFREGCVMGTVCRLLPCVKPRRQSESHISSVTPLPPSQRLDKQDQHLEKLQKRRKRVAQVSARLNVCHLV